MKLYLKMLLQTFTFYHFVFKFTSSKIIYLTFDDGPSALYTRYILDTLDHFCAKATFFLVGENVQRYPGIVAKIQASGHSIGLHTFSHKRLDRMCKREFIAEIIKNQVAIEEITGYRPFIFRPPHGKIGIRNFIWSISHGLRIVHFTITSSDWQANSGFEIIQTIRNHRIRGGEILCFHDTVRHTVDALPLILDELRGLGFYFAPMIFSY
jgi:peptidoglycan/xylan/chitin deacetylase (PgdA/CDA1 family)